MRSAGDILLAFNEKSQGVAHISYSQIYNKGSLKWNILRDCSKYYRLIFYALFESLEGKRGENLKNK